MADTADDLQRVLDDLSYAQSFFPDEEECEGFYVESVFREQNRVRQSLARAELILRDLPAGVIGALDELRDSDIVGSVYVIGRGAGAYDFLVGANPEDIMRALVRNVQSETTLEILRRTFAGICRNRAEEITTRTHEGREM